MNYLVIEGYKDAADTFSQECGLKPNVDLDSIQDRMEIRNAIQSGDIENAIERVNDLNPDVSTIIYVFLRGSTMINILLMHHSQACPASDETQVNTFSLQNESIIPSPSDCV